MNSAKKLTPPEEPMTWPTVFVSRTYFIGLVAQKKMWWYSFCIFYTLSNINRPLTEQCEDAEVTKFQFHLRKRQSSNGPHWKSLPTKLQRFCR
jgi:hypothetical protein